MGASAGDLPELAPEASADAVQAVARIQAVADGSPVDVISGLPPPEQPEHLAADLPEGRRWSLPDLPLEARVELAGTDRPVGGRPVGLPAGMQ